MEGGVDEHISIIVAYDGFESNIRELKECIDLLEETDKDRYAYGINVLRTKIWQEFDKMCNNKAQYSAQEWRALSESHYQKTQRDNNS